MNFRTEIKFKNPSFQIDHNGKIFAIGSCFAQNISSLLQYDGFHVLTNPFGIVYNPESLSKQLCRVLDKKTYSENDLRIHNGLWYSFDHHGEYSHIDKNQCVKNINDSIYRASEFLSTGSLIIITLGTSWIYKFRETGETVSNCHKIPNAEFEKSLMTVDEVEQQLSEVVEDIYKLNGHIKILFTVSPVRHLKDGFEENSISKSILRLAVRQLIDKFSYVEYFPSYEIQLDDLRDYRFYDSDRVHPSKEAIEYIYRLFKRQYMKEGTLKLAERVADLNRRFDHKLLHPDSEASIKFTEDTKKSAQSLMNEHPEIFIRQMN